MSAAARQRIAHEATHAIAYLLQPDPDIQGAAGHLVAALAAIGEIDPPDHLAAVFAAIGEVDPDHD